jgi:hypothetical protein
VSAVRARGGDRPERLRAGVPRVRGGLDGAEDGARGRGGAFAGGWAQIGAEEAGGGLAGGFGGGGGVALAGVVVAVAGEIEQGHRRGDAGLGGDEALADLGEAFERGECVAGLGGFEPGEEVAGREVVLAAEGEQAAVGGEEVFEEGVGVGGLVGGVRGLVRGSEG